MEAKLNSQEILQLAANGEKASFALYSSASVLARCEKVKKIFQRIARDELGHLLSLHIKFERLYPQLAKKLDITLPIPDESEVKRLAEIKESAEALQSAIHEEERSLHLYLQLVKAAEDEWARKVLRSIIRDEISHIKALSSLRKERIEKTIANEKSFH
jgi:rubrerythrin